MATPEYPALTDAVQRVLAGIDDLNERRERARWFIKTVTSHGGTVEHSPTCSGHDCAGCCSDRIQLGNIKSVVTAIENLGLLGAAA